MGLAEEAELVAHEFALAQVCVRAVGWWALWEWLGRNGFVPGYLRRVSVHEELATTA